MGRRGLRADANQVKQYLLRVVRGPARTGHTPMRTATATMPQIPQLADDRVLNTAETALALKLISRMDFLRLKTIARWHARGLPPDVAWDDLLQEALTRVIVGSRRKPQDVSMVAFLAGIMRSLRAEHWRRVRGGPRSETLRIDHQDLSSAAALPGPAADFEHALIARAH